MKSTKGIKAKIQNTKTNQPDLLVSCNLLIPAVKDAIEATIT